jgi:hypothetical protein
MADLPPTNEEEHVRKLAEQFDAYLEEIKRIIRTGVSSVKHVLNSKKINGYSFNDLINIIRDEVNAHENDPNNPHNNTLAGLGGMPVADYENRALSFFPKDAVPISRYPALNYSVSGTALTIAAGTVTFYGRKVSYPQQVITLTGAAKQYIKSVVSGKYPNRVATFVTTTTDSESNMVCLSAIVTNAGGVYTVTQTPCVRIGVARISTDVHGNSVPATVGPQSAPAAIKPGWIS